MTTKIVRATPDDLKDVADLFDAYRQSYGQKADQEGATAFIAARLEKADSVIFLALNEAAAVGFTQVYPSFSSVAMRPIWILNDLFVTESARRQGVATALMEKAKEFAKETGAAWLALKTATDNHPAKTLYKKLGWVRNDEFIHYTYNFQ